MVTKIDLRMQYKTETGTDWEYAQTEDKMNWLEERVISMTNSIINFTETLQNGKK